MTAAPVSPRLVGLAPVIARGTKLVVTLEESIAAGGFGSAVLEAITEAALTDESLRGIAVPTLVIGAERDTVAPIATNAARFAEMIPGATLVRLDSGHYTFLSECGPAGPPPLCSDPAGVDRKVVHADAAARAADFFNRVLQ